MEISDQKHLIKLDLYVDESGEFLETSNVPSERKRLDPAQSFPSQLAGFVVPRRDIRTDAQLILENCKKAAFIRPTESFKGQSLHGKRLRGFVRQLLREFQKRPHWELCRIVNQEGLSFGGQAASYTNIFAEIILRILELKSADEPESHIDIHVYATRFMRRQEHFNQSTTDEEYSSRINEYVKFLSVRRGLAPESSRWSVGKPDFSLGSHHPALVIADVLSNASKDDFGKLDPKTSAKRSDVTKMFIDALGERNWTMTVRELFERVSLLSEEYSFGMALIAIAETLGSEEYSDDYDPSFVEKAKDHIARINKKLAWMGARGRDPQLATVLNWLDQIVGQQRLIERGYQLAQWLISYVIQPLRKQLLDLDEQETIDWFEYGVRRWALTAANHGGNLSNADGQSRAMHAIAHRLARRWERAPILFDGLIAQAVHLTDAFEFDRVSKDMRLVAESMETQADLFSKYRAGEFPDSIKFDIRAKALGTLLQNEMLKDNDDWQQLRDLSDQAISEFIDPKDKARQYQYRCHLETLAGDYASARRYLIWSMRKIETEEFDCSHSAIVRFLAEQSDEPRWQRDFTVSHWLRLGKTICLNAASEQEKFLRAYDASKLFEMYVDSRSLSEFPVHSILRSISVIEASRRKFGPAFRALELLHALNPIEKNEFVMAVILCAGQAEFAALLWQNDNRKAKELIDCESSVAAGLKQLFQRMECKGIADLPKIAELIERWKVNVNLVLNKETSPNSAKKQLFEIASQVRY